MLQCSVKKIKLPRRPPPHTPHPRHLHSSLPRWTAVPLDISSIPDTPTSSNVRPRRKTAGETSDPKEYIRASALRDLEAILARPYPRYKPLMVWSLYNEVLRHHDLQKVPLEIHQGVLRKCSPPPEEMRKTLALKIARKDMRYDYHPFEPRFQTIIRNIRAAGYEPELDDFHIILQQFAAVGHHRAAMQVLQEITHSGIQRAPKTFGLCLQALCHRLTLPVWHEHRETIVAEVARYCTRLLAQMAEENVGFTSANVDLTIRVLKETMDLDAFERLMRYAYGIDLRYPDRAPLEDWQSDSGPLANVASPKPPSAIAPSQRLPFSTDALNTTIDMLGRHQQISILVQAFEVLTSPLPPGANETSAFDDEDDFGVSEPNVTTFQRPSARPNKMSYHMLLKWISRADHAVFLRHYTLQAMKLYHAEDRRLRGDCMRIIGPETLADDSVPEGAELKLPKDIRPPRFTVDRNLLLPAFAYAKRNKDMELLRWIFWNSCRVLRKKRTDIKFYSEVCAVWEARDKERAAAERAALMLNNVEVSSDVFSESAASPATNIEAKSAAESATETEALPTDVVATPEPTVAEGSHPLISAFLGSAPSFGELSPSKAPSAEKTKSKATKSVELPSAPYFDVDLDAPQPSLTSFRPRTFNIDQHLGMLRTARGQLKEFVKVVAGALEFKTHRIKEQLGRRVWRGRNVYMRDRDSRLVILREEWKRKVNFRDPDAAQTDPLKTVPAAVVQQTTSTALFSYELPPHQSQSSPPIPSGWFTRAPKPTQALVADEQPESGQSQSGNSQPEQSQPVNSQVERSASSTKA